MSQEKIEKLRQIKEMIIDFNIQELREPEIMRELVILFNAIGDIFNMVRLPRGTNIDNIQNYGSIRFYKNKEMSELIRQKIDHEKYKIKRYTPEEDKYIMENYNKKSHLEIAKSIGRTRDGIENRYKKLIQKSNISNIS